MLFLPLLGWAEKDSLRQNDDLAGWIAKEKKKSQAFRNEGAYNTALASLDSLLGNLWRDPSSDEEKVQLAWVYANKGYIQAEMQGDFLLGKDSYLQALAIFDEISRSDYLVARHIYQPLANILTRLGENQQAGTLLNHFLEKAREIGDPAAIADACNDLGRVAMNENDPTRALGYFSDGIREANLSARHIGLLYSSMAEAELQVDQKDSAAAHAQLAVRVLEPAYRAEPSLLLQEYLAWAWLIYGQATLALNRTNEAQLALEKALSIFPDGHRVTAKIHLTMGLMHLQQEKGDRALESFQAALSILIPDPALKKGTAFNPDASALFAEVTLSEALAGKGRACRLLYQQNGDTNFLIQALDHYQLYFQCEENLRTHYLSQSSKLRLGQGWHSLAEEALEATFILFQQSENPHWAEVGYKLTERTRAIVLSESMRGLWGANQVLPGQSLMAREDSLALRELYLEDVIREESGLSEAEVRSLEEQIQVIRVKRQLVIEQIREEQPAYNRLRVQQGQIDLEALHRWLQDEKAELLEVFAGQKFLHVFRVRQGKVYWHRVETEQCNRAISKLEKALASPGMKAEEGFNQSSVALFRLLFEGQNSFPLPERLVVVPDGFLSRFPWEVLLTEKTNQSSWRSLPYLLKSTTLSYAPSARFLLRPFQSKANKSVLSIAPKFRGEMDIYLKESSSWARELAETWQGNSLTDEQANKATVFKEAGNYSILHFSSHAQADQELPGESYIMLAPGNKGDHEKLTVSELLRLNLQADLVTLMSCETGLGKYFEGEGMLSLARSFAWSGSRNTISALWRINHQASSHIMREFYAQLGQGVAMEEALRQAKLNYLSDEENDQAGVHPFYWSGTGVDRPNGRYHFSYPKSLPVEWSCGGICS